MFKNSFGWLCWMIEGNIKQNKIELLRVLTFKLNLGQDSHRHRIDPDQVCSCSRRCLGDVVMVLGRLEDGSENPEGRASTTNTAATISRTAASTCIDAVFVSNPSPATISPAIASAAVSKLSNNVGSICDGHARREIAQMVEDRGSTLCCVRSVAVAVRGVSSSRQHDSVWRKLVVHCVCSGGHVPGISLDHKACKRVVEPVVPLFIPSDPVRTTTLGYLADRTRW